MTSPVGYHRNQVNLDPCIILHFIIESHLSVLGITAPGHKVHIIPETLPIALVLVESGICNHLSPIGLIKSVCYT